MAIRRFSGEATVIEYIKEQGMEPDMVDLWGNGIELSIQARGMEPLEATPGSGWHLICTVDNGEAWIR